METITHQVTPSTIDFLPLLGTDYIEFYVGNAKQAAHYYKTAFGFQSLAYAGPETGLRDFARYAVRQNKLTFVFTTALKRGNSISDHVYKHGDGVRLCERLRGPGEYIPRGIVPASQRTDAPLS